RRLLPKAHRFRSWASTTPSSSAPRTRAPPAPALAAAFLRPAYSPSSSLTQPAASENLQVGFQCASLFHGLQYRDHIPRTCPGSLQFLDQILHRSPFFQVDAVHRLVLGLYRGLLHDL